jgi:biotin synthase
MLQFVTMKTSHTLDNLKSLLHEPLTTLVARADRIRAETMGNHLELCSIQNAKSGRCSEDCKFCAQSGHYETKVEDYPLLSREALVQAGRRAQEIGAARFGIVTSGNRLTDAEITCIGDAIAELVQHVGIQVCASLGALELEQFERLREAGLTRYHHNIETSRRYYREIVTTHDFEQRLDTVRAAKAAGLQTCSGGIIGMGETAADRLDMAVTLRDLDVDSVPINVLNPIPGTPLSHLTPISVEEVVRTIAIFRIVLEHRTVKLAAGRETTLGDRQAEGFQAGANGMIIGGYLTIKGAALATDYALVEEVQRLWNQSRSS